MEPHVSETLATRRYRRLINELGGGHGFGRGWMARVAEEIGVTRVYVHQVVKKKRSNVGVDALEKAISTLAKAHKDLSIDYFSDETLTDDEAWERYKPKDNMARTKTHPGGHATAKRMKDLIEELKVERGSGWSATDALGLSRSYVNKILFGERESVGVGAVRTVCETLGISERFFDAESGSYLNFKTATPVAHQIEIGAIESDALHWRASKMGISTSELANRLIREGLARLRDCP